MSEQRAGLESDPSREEGNKQMCKRLSVHNSSLDNVTAPTHSSICNDGEEVINSCDFTNQTKRVKLIVEYHNPGRKPLTV